jgi:hypothetical protein
MRVDLLIQLHSLTNGDHALTVSTSTISEWKLPLQEICKGDMKRKMDRDRR